jgi:hypothetical protein
MSRLPVPVYVPGAIMTTSPAVLASIAAWTVGYPLGTYRSTAMVLAPERSHIVATPIKKERTLIARLQSTDRSSTT